MAAGLDEVRGAGSPNNGTHAMVRWYKRLVSRRDVVPWVIVIICTLVLSARCGFPRRKLVRPLSY
ncbi:hypothetical protein AJ88_28660 [Mesorhizobium amorphae CCBAU 01583]|nr:hypothetical protein AJ88_28660 [Mesorhizobium amorphae CCBAU 01583]